MTLSATAELSGSTVTITAVAEGDAEITVSAKDATNDAVSQTFSVEVEGLPENKPPTVRTIGTVSLNLEDKTSKAIDLSEYFTDPEGDTLEYTAASGNDAVATVERSGSMVTITAVAEGDARDHRQRQGTPRTMRCRRRSRSR